MTCGIPQGSSLGQLLFLIYINDLPNCSNALTFRIFADDTNVFASARDLKVLEKIVNSELKKVKIWCDVNRLSIIFSKTTGGPGSHCEELFIYLFLIFMQMFCETNDKVTYLPPTSTIT